MAQGCNGQGKEGLSDMVRLLKEKFDEEVSDRKLLCLMQNAIGKIVDVLQMRGTKQCFLQLDDDHGRGPNTTEHSSSSSY